MSCFDPKGQLTRDMLEKLYVSDHLTIELVAARMGCGATTVARALRQHKIPIRSRQDYRRAFSRDKLQELYLQKGFTQDQIGRLFGCSQRTVSRRLQELGIATRGVGPVSQYVVASDLLETSAPELAYVVGLIASDGCLTQGNHEVEFVSSEIEMVELYLRGLRLTNVTAQVANHPGRRPWYRIRLSDRQYRSFLEGIGLTPAKSKTIGPLKVPDDVFADFARGLLDGDGSWYITRSWQGRYRYLRVELCSASHCFLDWIHNKISALAGLEGNLRSRRSGRSHDLHYASQKALALGRWLYYSPNVLALSRKRQIWERMQRIADSRR